MALQQLTLYLDRHLVDYDVVPHSLAYTAQELAAAAHIPGRRVAKTVMVKLDGRLVMAVLPACHRIDLGRLAEVTGVSRADIAREEEFEDLFPGCPVGAMPPFGNLWSVPVIASEALAGAEWIAFHAGSHTELVTLRFADFQRLAAPAVMPFSVPA